MSLFTAQNLAMSYGPLDVFDGVTCAAAEGDRIGLVGPNGEGKTTLLRIIAGDLQATGGAVFKRKGLKVGYLSQDPPSPGEKTLWEDMLEVFDDLRAEEAALQGLELKMSNPSAGKDVFETYARRQHAFEVRGGYDYPLRIRQTLTGLGFRSGQFEMPLVHLSGGQRTRALLARLLLQRPDLLLLDEPTNHLDLRAVEWLENTLLSWHGAMVIVAHDRYFLDRVATKIWEMAWGELTHYRGNYGHYVIQRAGRQERLRKEYEAQQAFISKEQDYISRNIAGQNTRQAQGRRTRLQRMLKQNGVSSPRHRQRMQLTMQNRLRSGTLVLASKDLAVGYYAHPAKVAGEERSGGYVYKAKAPVSEQDTMLFRSEDVVLKRGERVGIIGANGSGKTTFVKTLLGSIPPMEGELRLGASLRLGYLAQVQAALDPKATVLDTLLGADPRLSVSEARHILARFLFSGDDVFKTTRTLSGGQRSRLALARLGRENANFLILDEPTNHLDIESQEVLEFMLGEFNGTVLLVSHDRYLIDAIATQVWDIENDHLQDYEGNYSAYLAARREAKGEVVVEQLPRSDAQQHREHSRTKRRDRREVEKRQAEAEAMEMKIHALELELAEIGQALEGASQHQQLAEVQRLGDRYAQVEQDLEALIEHWAAMA